MFVSVGRLGIRWPAQVYDSASATCLGEGRWHPQTYHVPLLPPHVCQAANSSRNGLHNIKDAHPQERQHYPNLR